MKSWWLSLDERDRKFLAIGSIIVLLLLAYLCLWEPMTSAKQQLTQQVAYNRDLLSFLQESKLQLANHPNFSKPKPVVNLPMLLHGALQNLTKAKIIDQQGANQVQVKLASVGFDSFVKWLVLFKRQYQIQITELHIKKLPAPGLVQASFILTLS